MMQKCNALALCLACGGWHCLPAEEAHLHFQVWMCTSALLRKREYRKQVADIATHLHGGLAAEALLEVAHQPQWQVALVHPVPHHRRLQLEPDVKVDLSSSKHGLCWS